jgi:GT2 family glycosyltransferase
VDLSVIIVNYNVKYFLEQCLHSVIKSIEGLHGEIIVVDNNSVDGSTQMLNDKFPKVKLIANKKNLGFSKANNQGIKKASGKYILILNPDTILQEDTLRKCFDFMESHPNAGSLGVKMIDGKGNFLPESKRSLPTPSVAFFKIFGLASLFPRSKTFGRYHLGYLDKDQVHKVEILPGAFMFIRKSVLDQIGFLDETFFMYGEDIDLSYRITQAGYDNYYFPETTIIHYKGESTKKGSINYVMVFYRAMMIFARKHFSRKNARLFGLLINSAIYIRASVSIIRRIIRTFAIPVTDVLLIYVGFLFIEPFWEQFKFGTEGYYPREYMHYMVPSFIIIWLFFLFISGAYERKIKPFDLIRGIALGTFTILMVYSLLPEYLRYSRALILLGTFWAAVAVFLSRVSIGMILRITRIEFSRKKRRIIIVGSEKESDRVLDILHEVDISPNFVGRISWSEAPQGEKFFGDLSQINEIIKINRIDEIVFCAKDIPSQEIIRTMLSITDNAVEFKIAPPESLSIIGSSSINTTGELYVVHFNSLSTRNARRRKRLFDIVSSFLLLVLSPVLIFLVKSPLGFLRNIVVVLLGIKTWVGFCELSEEINKDLPDIGKGILSPVAEKKEKLLSQETIRQFNLLYAKDYKLANDLSILIRDFRNLGN